MHFIPAEISSSIRVEARTSHILEDSPTTVTEQYLWSIMSHCMLVISYHIHQYEDLHVWVRKFIHKGTFIILYLQHFRQLIKLYNFLLKRQKTIIITNKITTCVA